MCVGQFVQPMGLPYMIAQLGPRCHILILVNVHTYEFDEYSSLGEK